MPHEGQGNPVKAFKGQNDCSVSNELLVFCNHKTKGIASVKNAPEIPKILFETKFLISIIY